MSLYEKAQNIAENVARKKEKENLPPAIKKKMSSDNTYSCKCFWGSGIRFS